MEDIERRGTIMDVVDYEDDRDDRHAGRYMSELGIKPQRMRPIASTGLPSY